MACLAAAGCGGSDGFDYGAGGTGPGHRKQQVALSAQQEVTLGNEAFEEVKAKEHPVAGEEGKRLTAHVTEIGNQIFDQALDNKPLREEINISDTDPYGTPWNFKTRIRRSPERPGQRLLPSRRQGRRVHRPARPDEGQGRLAGDGPRPRDRPRGGSPRQRAHRREQMYGQASDATDPTKARNGFGTT